MVLALVVALALPSAAAAAGLRVAGFVGDRPGDAGGAFVGPTAVSVDPGDVDDPDDDRIYVVEGLPGNNRVQRLDSNGNFELAWGKDVVAAGAPGDRGREFEVCRRGASCQAGRPGSGPGELRGPVALAADPDSGDVYVLDGGNRRVSRFSASGDPLGSWSVDVGVAANRDLGGAIAVDATAPHDIFVGDPATDRVLQFTAEGGLVRGWGRGVDDGGDAFQVCVEASACRAGGRVAGGGSAPPRWPEHLAVDRHGVVYGSVFMGTDFESHHTRTRILRFDSDAAPTAGDAGEAWLRALWARNDHRPPPLGAPSAVLTNGATEGIEIDPRDGSLLVFHNPFGTSGLDVVEHPAGRGGRPRLSLETVGTLPFLQNVSDMAVAEGGKAILLSSGTVRSQFGPSSFTGCRRASRDADCHGLVVLADDGPPRALLTGPPGLGTSAWVDAGGAASYRLEVSRDGRRWTPVGPERGALGTTFDPVPLDAATLMAESTPMVEPGLYKLRVVVAKKTERGLLTVVSGVSAFVAR